MTDPGRSPSAGYQSSSPESNEGAHGTAQPWGEWRATGLGSIRNEVRDIGVDRETRKTDRRRCKENNTLLEDNTVRCGGACL